jgi:histidinol dehydrogenase
MTDIIVADGRAEYEAISRLRARAAEAGAGIAAAAAQIMEAVKARGIDAVTEYSMKFDGSEPYEISGEQLKAAYETCDAQLIGAMQKAAENIRDYQTRLLKSSTVWETAGGSLGQLVRGLDRVGLYVPGGTAAYPSTVLMNAIPAKVAGVSELIMATPPTKHLNTAVLAAAYIEGRPGHCRRRGTGGRSAHVRRGVHSES